jgi:hypothetical protein
MPSGAKARINCGLSGTAEAVPFPKSGGPRALRQSETGQVPSLHEFFASCEAVPYPKPTYETRSSNSVVGLPGRSVPLTDASDPRKIRAND